MKWLEISVFVPQEAADVVVEYFRDLGTQGASIEDTLNSACVKGYLAKNDDLEGKCAALEESISRLEKEMGFTARTETSEVDDADWENCWKEYFHAAKVGERLVICPAWEDYAAKGREQVIYLYPGPAFGTGTHPTTAMCLRFIEERMPRGARVFDVGTGSGVLAIGAALEGAGEIEAMDYDLAAVNVARENFARNSLLRKIKAYQSDLLAGAKGRADFICANLIADLVMRLFDTLDAHLDMGGKLLASGIIEERVEEVEAAAKARGFRVLERKIEAGWVALLIGREESL